MKKFNRLFSILMCLCLLGTSTLGDAAMALAEDAVVENQDEGRTGSNEAAAETSDAEPELELGGEEEQNPSEQRESEPAPFDSVDYSAPAAASPEFDFGYAKLIADAALFGQSGADEVAVAWLEEDGVVLVTERVTASEDRLRVAFDCDGAVCEGWVDAYALRPMAEDEVDAFQNGITEAVCYQDNAEYPLMRLSVLPVEEDAADSSEAEDEIGNEQGAPESDEGEDESEPVEGGEADADDEAVEETDGETIEDEPELELGGEPTEPVDDAPVAAAGNPQPENGTESEDAASSDAVSMGLFNDEFELAIGETAPIVVEFSDGVTRAVSYGIQTSGVISVDENGVMTAIAEGETAVTVMCQEIAASAVLDVLVYDPEVAVSYTLMTTTLDAEPFSVELDADELDVGQTAQVSVDAPSDGVAFATSDATVATVDESGRVVAVGKGRCTITATVDGAAEGIELTVYDVPDAFEFAIENAKLAVGAQTATDVVFP